MDFTAVILIAAILPWILFQKKIGFVNTVFNNIQEGEEIELEIPVTKEIRLEKTLQNQEMHQEE